MRKLLLMLLFPLPLMASVTLTPKAPTYPIGVLPNSVRRVAVDVNNGGTDPCVVVTGVTCEVNWAVTGTGGATGTFSDPSHTNVTTLTNALPEVEVKIGTTAGTCSITGTIGSYTFSSTAGVTITATSVDTPTSTASFTFPVCSNAGTTLGDGTSSAKVLPFYDQAYQGQLIPLFSEVVGCVDQSGTWAITSQPVGGNGALTSASIRNPLFSATVTGRYTMTFTSACTGGTATSVIYVSPNAMPSYAVTPQGTVPQECYVDPSLTGTDYEVGPTQTYANLEALPNSNTIAAGSIIRIHNDDTSGTSPTTYAEEWQFNSSGSSTQPVWMCGVPDSSGNAPILNGANANMQKGVSGSGCAYLGIICTFGGGYGGGTPYGYYQAGSSSPRFVGMVGIHFENSTPGYSYYPSSALLSGTYQSGGTITGTATQTCTVTFSGYPANGVATVPLTGTNTIAAGTSISVTTQANGFFTAPTSGTLSNGTATCSGSATFSTVSGVGNLAAYDSGASCINLRGGSDIVVAGDEMQNCANGIITTENANSGWANITQNVYLYGNHESQNGWSTDNTEHGMYLQTFFLAAVGNRVDNYLSTAQGSCIKWRGVGGIFEANYCAPGPARIWDGIDNQDAGDYINMDWYLAAPGDSTCTDSLYCDGDQMGTALVYYQESQQHDSIFANDFDASNAEYQIHYGEDHDGGMADRNGTLNFYFNTLNNAQVVFDTGSSLGYYPFLLQRVNATNNIFWYTGSYSMAFNQFEYIIYDGVTNLMKSGSFSIATPITGGSFNAHTANGWQAGCDYTCPWALTNPLQTHIYDLSSPNYLSTGTLPYNASTFAPVTGSAAIGAASALAGDMSLMPPNLQYNVSTGVLSQRTSIADLGAVSYSGGVVTNSNSAPQMFLLQ